MMIPHSAGRTVLAVLTAVTLAACNGSGATDPSPSAASTAPDPSSEPSAETATEASTPPSHEASAPLSPTEGLTGGIEPPTAAPDDFGEFVIPAPDQLTEEYAAWVLAEITRAEDQLTSMAIDAPDRDGSLPAAIREALRSTYAGDSLELETDVIRQTVSASDADEIFLADPGPTRVFSIRLLDATQECLLLEYVEDITLVAKNPPSPTTVIALLQPKPEIDGSEVNRTPWQMTNRAVPEDVTGRVCP